MTKSTPIVQLCVVANQLDAWEEKENYVNCQRKCGDIK
jgi:hypothetical protein